MDGLEQTISSVLSDPSAMEQILAMARALGVSPPDTSAAPQAQGASNAPPEAPAAPPEALDPMARSLIAALSRTGAGSSRQGALFSALAPFVRPEKREKLERAARVAQLAQLAGSALRTMDFKP